MNAVIVAIITPLVFSQLYTQPVVYYQVPYYAGKIKSVSVLDYPLGAIDTQYAFGQTPAFQNALTSPYALQTPYLQTPYQQLQYPGLTPGLGLGLYQNTLARELTGGYLNEFRDVTGSLNNHGILHREPATIADHASYMSLINDKDNFQASGCGWDATLVKCTDALGLCKGGCRDFAVSASATLHDCRCIPYGYAALLKLVGK